MKLNIKLSLGSKGSRSAKALAQSLSQAVGYKVFRTTKTMVKRRQLAYGMGVDKLSQYRWFEQQGLSALSYTTDPVVAKAWCEEGDVVIGRKLLSASCGKGIVLLKKGDEWQSCPVYTLYKKKKREFRVHVFKDKVVSIVEKKARSNWEGVRNTHIRNLANGYVFCQDVVDLPPNIHELAIAASKVVASDFKGVDIGFNEKHNDLFIIEVNAAPGIEGTNLNKYVSTIVSTI